MKYLLRPFRNLAAPAILGLGVWAVVPAAPAQSQLSNLLQHLNPLLGRSSQGYLGVLVGDVDNDSVSRLKLRDTHGALITLIDHDAPAGSTLHVNDVVLSVNGQAVENSEQFTRAMREIPAGRTVTLVVSRDGAQQTIAVKLCDRKVMEHDVWNKMNSADTFAPPPTGMAILGGGDAPVPGFHMPLFAGSLNVGALVEPLTSQMADYLGVPSGVMVKQVARKSEAANAGLKAFDVILKVGGESIKTTADWDRALRGNEGKQVQLTILRDRKQQTLNLQVDSKKHSQIIWEDPVSPGETAEMAELDKGLTEQLQQQMQEFRSQFDARQVEELRKQAEQWADSFKAEKFPEMKFDPQQMDEFRKQMEEFSRSFKAEDFKIDPRQMKELRQQMEEFRKEFPRDFEMDRRQLDELQKELQNLHLPCAGKMV